MLNWYESIDTVPSFQWWTILLNWLNLNWALYDWPQFENQQLGLEATGIESNEIKIADTTEMTKVNKAGVDLPKETAEEIRPCWSKPRSSK